MTTYRTKFSCGAIQGEWVENESDGAVHGKISAFADLANCNVADLYTSAIYAGRIEPIAFKWGSDAFGGMTFYAVKEES